MSSKDILTILLLISPVFLVQVGMVIYSIIDLSHRKTLRGPRWVWVVLLIFGVFAVPTGIVLSGLYLAWGRQPGMEADDDSD
jgi:hypothetical protein